MIGIFISIPLLWMVDFLNESHQCQLNMKPPHLIYIIGLNAVLIFIPAIILPILYVIIYIKTKSHGLIEQRNSSKKSKKTELKKVKQLNTSDDDLLINKIEKEFDKKHEDQIIEHKFKISILKPDSRKNDASNGNLSKGAFIKSSISENNNSNKKSELFINQKGKRKNNLFFIIIVTIVFFSCQLPLHIFLCWSYLIDHFYLQTNLVLIAEEEHIALINFIYNILLFIYFLHCISNSIIYNILSDKFRKAFLSSIRNLFIF